MKTQMDYAYEFLLEGPKTVRQIAKQLGVTTKQAGHCMYRLRDQGKVTYEGNARGGLYSIPNYRPKPNHFPRLGIWGL